MAGNTSDNKTLRSFLAKIETQYGKARRIWGDGARHPDRNGTFRRRAAFTASKTGVGAYVR